MMKRSQWTILVLVAALCLLAGCGRSNAPGQPAPDPIPAGEKDQPPAPSAGLPEPAEPPAEPSGGTLEKAEAPAEESGEDLAFEPTAGEEPPAETTEDPAPDPLEERETAPDAAAEPEQEPAPEPAPEGESVRAGGTYTISVTLEGGSGRAGVDSPAKLRYDETGKCWATIVWSSPNFDYMKVDGQRYDPINTEGNSTFEIPVAAFDQKLDVIADTVAMSEPHEVEYTLTFDSASMEDA